MYKAVTEDDTDRIKQMITEDFIDVNSVIWVSIATCIHWINTATYVLYVIINIIINYLRIYNYVTRPAKQDIP